jgi:sulfur carrier protein
MKQQSTKLGIFVNGRAVFTGATTVAGLLDEQGYAGLKVATALNGDFVPERTRATATLQPGDRIEIVSARQGG